VDRSAVGNCVAIPANSYAIYDGQDGGAGGNPAPAGDTLVVCVGSRASAVGSTAITDCLCAVNTYAASGSNNNAGACTACVNNGAQRISAAGSIAAASCLCPSSFYEALDNAATCFACDDTRDSDAGSALISDCKCPVDTYAASGANDNGAGGSGCAACASGNSMRRTSAAGSTLGNSCVCPSNTYGDHASGSSHSLS
jgi:hypothetical protein